MSIKAIKNFFFVRSKTWKPETEDDWEIALEEYKKHSENIDMIFLKELDKNLGSKTLIKEEVFSLFAWAYNIQDIIKNKTKEQDKESHSWMDLVDEDTDEELVEAFELQDSIERLENEKKDRWLNIDKETALGIVKENGEDLRFINKQYRKDKDVVLEAVKTDGHALRYADELLKNDKEIIIQALRQNGHAIESASNYLKEDREVALTAILSCAEGEEACHALNEYVDKEFKKDKEVMLEVVKLDGSALYCADESLKKDKDVVLAAAKNRGDSFMDAHESLQCDREFVLQIVKEDGMALQFASSKLKKDKEIILAAITKYPHFISYADESMQKDEDILRAIDEMTK